MDAHRGDVTVIHIFNRELIFRTFDASKCEMVKGALANKNVEYSVKVYNRRMSSSWNRGMFAQLGENRAFDFEYSIYVKKSDVDFAKYALRDIKVY